MTWHQHPGALRRCPEPLVKLLTAHMHARLMLQSVQRVESKLLDELVRVLDELPPAEQERLLQHAVQEASRRIVPAWRDDGPSSLS